MVKFDTLLVVQAQSSPSPRVIIMVDKQGEAPLEDEDSSFGLLKMFLVVPSTDLLKSHLNGCNRDLVLFEVFS